MNEIINKVANSSLEVFDLEDYYDNKPRVTLDISQWLFEGLVLKENDFRKALKEYNWSQYKDHYVAINCLTEAIIPAWATILITSHLIPFAKKIVCGSIKDLDNAIYQDILETIDFSFYINKSVILKGCSKKPVPENAYVFALQKLQPFAKSIMFGEACSAVPLFKKSKEY